MFQLFKWTKADRKRDAFKRLTVVAREKGVDRKVARTQIRKVIWENRNSAPSIFAGIPSRRQRRAIAKLNGGLEYFTPLYNN